MKKNNKLIAILTLTILALLLSSCTSAKSNVHEKDTIRLQSIDSTVEVVCANQWSYAQVFDELVARYPDYMMTNDTGDFAPEDTALPAYGPIYPQQPIEETARSLYNDKGLKDGMITTAPCFRYDGGSVSGIYGGLPFILNLKVDDSVISKISLDFIVFDLDPYECWVNLRDVLVAQFGQPSIEYPDTGAMTKLNDITRDLAKMESAELKEKYPPSELYRLALRWDIDGKAEIAIGLVHADEFISSSNLLKIEIA